MLVHRVTAMVAMHLVDWRGLIPFFKAGFVGRLRGSHALLARRRRRLGPGRRRSSGSLVGVPVHPHLVRCRLVLSSGRGGRRGGRRGDGRSRRGSLGKREATGGEGGCNQ